MIVTQEWTHGISMMQQTVLLTAIRGPDGMPKYGGVKMLLRWYRRCVLVSATDGKVLDNPYDYNGGSFTGPSIDYSPGFGTSWQPLMDKVVDDYIRELDAIPHHFQLHLLHASEIVGYKHPDEAIRVWWCGLYHRLVADMHLHAETEGEMDARLGDSRSGWLARADRATVA